MPVGRPLLFNTVGELSDKIDAYFNNCDDNKKPYTISGLAYFLNTNRQTLINYSNKEQFFDTVAKAKSRIEAYAAEQLYRKEQTRGITFDLQNNFGWREEKSVNVHDDKLDAFIKAYRGDTETKTN